MICPYCGTYIEPDSDYCQNCNKPLLVNFRKKTINSDQIFDKELLNLNHYHIQDDFFDYDIIKDENIEKKIDEINEILDQKQKSGESIGTTLLEKASLYYKIRDSYAALKILELALSYFIEENDFLNTAVSHNEIGLIQEELGFFDDAINHFEQSIENLKKINAYRKLILVYNNLANVYFQVNDLEHSYEFYNEGLNLAEQNNYISEEIKTSSNLVDVLFSLKNYDKIKIILNRNLEYFRQSGDIYGTLISLIKLGRLNYHLGSENYQYSQQYLIETLDLINNIKGQNFLITNAQFKWECYLYLGKLNLFWKNYKEAEDYLLKSLEAIRIFELRENLSEAKILKNLAKFYSIKGDFKNAIDYYDLSNEIYYKFGNDYEVAHLKCKKAQIYLNKTENETQAIKSYEEALEIFEDQNFIKNSAEILHKLGDIYINKGNISLALYNFELARNYYKELQDHYNYNLLTEKINSLEN